MMPGNFQIPKGEQWVFQVRNLRYTHVFRLLFSHPKLACFLLSMKHFWWGTILAVLIFAVLGGLLMTMNSAPEYGGDIRVGTQFVLDTVGPLELSEGRIHWPEKTARELPATLSLRHCQLDVADAWEGFTPLRKSLHPMGVVVCRDGIGVWAKDEDGTLLTRQLVLPFSRLPDTGKPFQLNAETQPTVCKFIFMVLCGSFFLEFALMIVKTLLLVAVALAVIWLLMGRVRTFRAIPHLILLGINLALPAALVAVLWGVASIPGDFDTHFIIAFFLYVLYTSIEGRRGHFVPAQR